ncbi:MAG: hypothetical protein JXB15_14715 [Anaerolineales bacterium]|nr:hypothetical protein [Anaerolineales bacterium]
MRITREILLGIVRDTIARRARLDRGLMAVYLCGSMLGDEFMLGGAGDVDLVFIHDEAPPVEREIVHLADEVHLDIAHHSEKDYRQARQLKEDPWLGPALKSCRALHDPRHFLDFTQASVRGQYERADHIFARARRQLERARSLWFGLQSGSADPEPKRTLNYLRAVGLAANAIASLSGPPLTERRFLLDFPARAEALERPGLFAGLLGLLGAPNLPAGVLPAWLASWAQAYAALGDERPARLHPARNLYYARAFEALLNSPRPETVLWPLLRTWTLAADHLSAEAQERADWQQAVGQLGLLGAGLVERLQALDSYLDLVDETQETWAKTNGV